MIALAPRSGTEGGPAILQEMDLESVDKVLDDINEQQDQMAQIRDAMSVPLGGAAQIDDDDLLAELEVQSSYTSPPFPPFPSFPLPFLYECTDDLLLLIILRQ